MIEFVQGPNNQACSPEERRYIETLLRSCNDITSFSFILNWTYNNPGHFSSMQYDYNIRGFLDELAALVNSRYHKVQVMGSIHEDVYGHSSQLISQYTQYNEAVPCLVSDKYIRFQIRQDPKHAKMLRHLNETVVFHFLVDKPTIIKVHQKLSKQVYLHPGIVHDMFPYSNYKRVTYLQ